MNNSELTISLGHTVNANPFAKHLSFLAVFRQANRCSNLVVFDVGLLQNLQSKFYTVGFFAWLHIVSVLELGNLFCCSWLLATLELVRVS